MWLDSGLSVRADIILADFFIETSCYKFFKKDGGNQQPPSLLKILSITNLVFSQLKTSY